jgi:hypothetical protein
VTTCQYCGEPFEPNPRARTPQKFCSTRHRVYFHREGGGLVETPATGRGEPASNSVAGAIDALGAVQLPDTKAAGAITVDRVSAYPHDWKVTVPPKSATAAAKIADALNEHADDLQTLARLISQAVSPKR